MKPQTSAPDEAPEAPETTAASSCRVVAAQELGELMRALAHPQRIMIIEHLRDGARDVSSMAAWLDVSTSRISQHLSVLRAHHLVRERREGRHVFYSLVAPELAAWLANGLSFVEAEIWDTAERYAACEQARQIWLDPAPDTTPR